MDGIKQYGDLSDKELLEFLNELEDGDSEIQEAQSDMEGKIAKEEELASMSELPENTQLEAYYGNDAWRKPGANGTFLFGAEGQRKANTASAKACKEKAKRLKADRIEIQRKAFQQEKIRLSDPVGNENIKLLVSLLVNNHSEMIAKYSAFINRRLTFLLNPFIPRRLRMCKVMYPDSIKQSPGFLYRASKEFGQGLTFWATPDIPNFLAQNTEQDILKKNKPEFLISIDKAVKSYHEHYTKRADKEIKYASSIIQKGVYSYFDLLRLNPFWFDALYTELLNTKKI